MANDNLANDHKATQIDNESVGEWFRDARKVKHLTIDEVARELKLKANIIKAIEDDDIENLPPSTYLFGYVRNYARLLGLPADEAVSRYENIDLKKPELVARALQNPRKPVESATGISKTKIAFVILILVVLGVAGLALFQSVDLQDILRMTRFTGHQNTNTSGDVVERRITLQPAQTQDEVPPAEEKPLETNQDAAGADTKTGQVTQAVPEPAQQPESPEQTWPVDKEDTAVQQPPQPAVNDSVVVLEFSEDCWTEIKDAKGERLVFFLMKAGTRKEIHGDFPLNVFVGNARGVKVTYNNNNFDIGPYVRGNLAHFTIE